MSITTKVYTSPVGDLIIGSYNDKLCLCDWKYRKMRNTVDERIKKFFNADYAEGSTPVIVQTIEQLDAYFNEEREDFDIPLNLAGSAFQQSVWEELQKIPFGETESYLGLSRRLGDEKAIRAVASANGANAISIIVPCHRIIGSNGELTGYAGGLPAKKKLLQLEKSLNQLSLF